MPSAMGEATRPRAPSSPIGEAYTAPPRRTQEQPLAPAPSAPAGDGGQIDSRSKMMF